MRCYNCHEPGHLARKCTKPQVNRNQTPPQPAPPNTERAMVTTSNPTSAAGGSSQTSALVVQHEASFDWNSEIQRLNISAPENQTTSDNMAFMASAPADQDSASEDQDSDDNLALMTQILSAPVHGLYAEEVSYVFCTPECCGKVEAYRLHNADLIQEYNDIKKHNFTLMNNEKLYKEKIKAQRKDNAKLKEDLSVKSCNYEYDKVIMNNLIKDLEEIKLKYQANEINIKKYDTSSRWSKIFVMFN